MPSGLPLTSMNVTVQTIAELLERDRVACCGSGAEPPSFFAPRRRLAIALAVLSRDSPAQ